jgi:hypothetical protein
MAGERWGSSGDEFSEARDGQRIEEIAPRERKAHKHPYGWFQVNRLAGWESSNNPDFADRARNS